MVADLLGSLAFASEEPAFSENHDFAVSDDFANDNPVADEALQPVFVRGSVLDACEAHDRVARFADSSRIAAVDSDDNGLYRLFRNR